MLHFAPEFCYLKKFKNLPNIEYYSADLKSPRAMLKIDITNIQIPNESYDVIITSHILAHVDDDLKAMKELCRIQKTGGWSIHVEPIKYSNEKTFTDPLVKTPKERQKVYGHYDHKRAYGTDYKQRLESGGFKVEIIKTENFCTEEEINRMGLKKGFEIYLCKK